MTSLLIASALCIVLLIPILLRIFVFKKPSHDTDEIDGGVTHYTDTDAPKEIQSTQIVSFFCEFSATDLSESSSPIAGRYYTFHAEEDTGSFEARGGGTVFAERAFVPDKTFFEALQQIVVQHDLAQYNGQFYTVSGLPPDFGMKLEIRYDSGEQILCSNNQSCLIPLKAMEELVYLFHPNQFKNQEQE